MTGENLHPSVAEIEEFLHLLCEVAAKQTLPRFRQSLVVDNKEALAFDPVTEADREAERAIRAQIRARYPQHGILGEEEGAENADADYCWIIDPIDGTRSFICGLPSWGTLIGLYHKGKPVAGMIQQPYTGERFYAAGEGSYLKLCTGAASRLQTRSTQLLAQATVMTTSPRLFSGRELAAYDRLENACQLARYGYDCYAYAMLASGQIDLVVESGLHVYDIAAIIPVIEQAGGIVTAWDGGSAAQGGPILAAANMRVHQSAMELLNG